MTLYPYLYHDICWVFDDPQTGLKDEALVLGASEMISTLLEAKAIPNADHGFSLLFSDKPFDHDVELAWIPAGAAARVIRQPVRSLPATGNRYTGDVAGERTVCWLCPGPLRILQ